MKTRETDKPKTFSLAPTEANVGLHGLEMKIWTGKSPAGRNCTILVAAVFVDDAQTAEEFPPDYNSGLALKRDDPKVNLLAEAVIHSLTLAAARNN